MYTQFYQLNSLPFSIAPNPRFLYLTEGHQAVLRELEDAIHGQVALSVLLGEVGTGKTTLSRVLLEELTSDIRSALVLNPRVTPAEFLQCILEELQLDYSDLKRSIRSLRTLLRQFIEEEKITGHQTLVIVDEAQQLQPGVLELIESLILEFGALQTPLSFILVGQPELDDVMKRSRHQDLYELIAHHCQLFPMSFSECQGYISHRLEIAGSHKPLFTPRALGEIHRLSMGIPRLINLICDRALLSGYARNVAPINSAMVKRASDELKLKPSIRRSWTFQAPSHKAIQHALGASVIFSLLAFSYLPIKQFMERDAAGSDSPLTQVDGFTAVQQASSFKAWLKAAQNQVHLTASRFTAAFNSDAVNPLEGLALALPQASLGNQQAQSNKPASINPNPSDQTRTEIVERTSLQAPTIKDDRVGAVTENPAQAHQENPDRESSNVPPNTQDLRQIGYTIPTESPHHEIPEFLLWVKEGLAPLADRAKFKEWITEFSVPHRDAQLNLFRSWIPRLPDNSTLNCLNAKALGLVCGHFWGQWSLLKEINLPVLLEIRLDNGRHADVLVRREGEDQMTLLYGNSEATFPTEDVLAQWTGRATIVGRASLKTTQSQDPSLKHTERSPETHSFLTASGLGDNAEKGLLALLGGLGRVNEPLIPHLDDQPSNHVKACRSVSLR